MTMIKKTLQYLALTAGLFGASITGCTSDQSPIDNRGDAGQRNDEHKYVWCSGSLVDVLSDVENCGMCGTTCDPSAECIDGICVLLQNDAGAACDLSRIEVDRYNCGSCGNVCLPIQDCRGGECLYTGYADDDNACLDRSDCAEGFTCETPRDWGISYCMDPAKRPCEFDDQCAENELCLIGYCTRVVPEECNGKDDNRDGERDEGLTMGACYTGPAETEGIGSCHAGTNLCVEGEWSLCVGEVWPVPETGIFACDGADNDCDSCPDNKHDPDTGECIPPEPRLFDIVMILDTSSSMDHEIAAAQEAIYLISTPFAGDSRYYFTLLTIPYTVAPGTMTEIDGVFYQGNPDDAVVQPLAPFPRFATALSAVRLTGFGDEQSYDITYLAAGERLSRLRFRPRATRVFIIFTDEEGRSYAVPQRTASQVCEPFDARPQDVFAVVTPDRYQSGWSCADITRTLSDDPGEVARDILDILAVTCER